MMAHNDCLSILNTTRQEIMKSSAQLVAEKSAACPDAAVIKTTEQQLISQHEKMQRYTGYASTYSNASMNSQLASQATIYIESFWISINNDLKNCTLGLSKIQTEPATVLEVDLLANQTNWNSIKSQFEIINKSINPSLNK
jgi:hypothetical protein